MGVFSSRCCKDATPSTRWGKGYPASTNNRTKYILEVPPYGLVLKYSFHLGSFLFLSLCLWRMLPSPYFHLHCWKFTKVFIRYFFFIDLVFFTQLLGPQGQFKLNTSRANLSFSLFLTFSSCHPCSGSQMIQSSCHFQEKAPSLHTAD